MPSPTPPSRPNTTSRTISFSVDDGTVSSPAVTRSVDLSVLPLPEINPETTNICRFFDAATGTHFFATSLDEQFAGITTVGSPTYRPNLVAEGIAFYVPSANLTWDSTGTKRRNPRCPGPQPSS